VNETTVITAGRRIRPVGRARTRGGLGTICTARLSTVALLAGLAAGLAVGWLVFPALLYTREPQPLQFSHAVHTGEAGMTCEGCHGFREDGSFAGIPALETCTGCHEEVLGETGAERILVERYVAAGVEIPWKVYARQPQNVHFPHAQHVVLAEIACPRCHGDHGESTSLPPYQENRISTYSRAIWGPRIAGGGPDVSDAMKMSDCSGCHVARGVHDSCVMCHR